MIFILLFIYFVLLSDDVIHYQVRCATSKLRVRGHVCCWAVCAVGVSWTSQIRCLCVVLVPVHVFVFFIVFIVLFSYSVTREAALAP